MNEGSKYNFKKINPTKTDWAHIEACYDSTVFHCEKWNNYVKKMGYSPFIAEVLLDENLIGYFVGASKWFFIKIIMAPSMGTGTYAQGLCMKESVSKEERIEIYLQLVKWLFKSRWASYVQICDWQLHYASDEPLLVWRDEKLDAAGVHYNIRRTYFLDTQRSEEELWAGLHYKSCKYAINKARKDGLFIRIVEKEDEIEAFVDNHYKHIQEMLNRKKSRGLPCQRRKNMSALCHSIFPDRGLMVQVVGLDENGREVSMASGIFGNGKAGSTFFTAGSSSQYMHYYPNELMVWEALRLLHERDAGDLIFGGTAHYKKKFGSTYANVPVMVFSRFQFLLGLYGKVKKLYAKYATKGK